MHACPVTRFCWVFLHHRRKNMHHKEKSTEERERRRKLILYSSWGTKGAISILLPTAVQCFLHVYAVAPAFSLHSGFANLYFFGV